MLSDVKVFLVTQLLRVVITAIVYIFCPVSPVWPNNQVTFSLMEFSYTEISALMSTHSLGKACFV